MSWLGLPKVSRQCAIESRGTRPIGVDLQCRMYGRMWSTSHSSSGSGLGFLLRKAFDSHLLALFQLCASPAVERP
ncbi:hypothetical protein PC116_g2217 [Phytophthora cactorum]|uniref:Uncharacterized protein n=1 Tax=Phytophthora cactorum TaxID=29920 RepID=A0A8T1LQD8_9STRA|nr:hypothetical protein PC114_g25662 [Phytophthora cactorum]KAG2888527.1 hypothetical protein PC117_g24878 [Phytophthora cactorum]KAG2967687.1 hypothetical protein PC119_g24406 [Phytophthora cactorum]KAG3134105.1 hypothetical protein C6341_g22292 [Phytophthora cactorum]KAG3137315.1 hypothetical protein PC128_g25763 [Phytophthora cactorum]